MTDHALELYPAELKRVVAILQAFDEIDGVDSPFPTLVGPIKLVTEEGDSMGSISDQVGGAWSWNPHG